MTLRFFNPGRRCGVRQMHFKCNSSAVVLWMAQVSLPNRFEMFALPFSAHGWKFFHFSLETAHTRTKKAGNSTAADRVPNECPWKPFTHIHTPCELRGSQLIEKSIAKVHSDTKTAILHMHERDKKRKMGFFALQPLETSAGNINPCCNPFSSFRASLMDIRSSWARPWASLASASRVSRAGSLGKEFLGENLEKIWG